MYDNTLHTLPINPINTSSQCILSTQLKRPSNTSQPIYFVQEPLPSPLKEPSTHGPSGKGENIAGGSNKNRSKRGSLFGGGGVGGGIGGGKYSLKEMEEGGTTRVVGGNESLKGGMGGMSGSRRYGKQPLLAQ